MRLLTFSLLLLHSILVLSERNDCGISSKSSKENFFEKLLNKLSISRILGGNEVPVGKWPWQVLIKTAPQSRPGSKFLCGGSIIGSRWILTAAHCFDSNRQVSYVMFGSVEAGENGSNMTVHAKNFTIHREYVSELAGIVGNVTMPNDIALIELEESLSFDENVSPVCLPSITSTIPEDAQVIATGFGLANDREDRENEMFASRTLLETVLPLIPFHVCKKRWKELAGDNITESQLCGGSYGHGTAPGDSGGPLIINSKSGRWFQIGVTSFGLNDDDYLLQQDASPGIYTNVEMYCDWIEEHTRGEARCQNGELIDATSSTAVPVLSFASIAIIIINMY